jgi:hypothetical protein
MKRPYLVHFTAIKTDEHIAIKAMCTLRLPTITLGQQKVELKGPSLPIQAVRLLKSNQFILKIIGLDRNQQVIYKKSLETDSFGNLTYKIPLIEEREKIDVLQVFELKKMPGLEILLGSYIPLKLNSPRKIVICDFDKTLVDTKYSSTKEVYHSLTKPLEFFPTVTHSLERLRLFIDEGHHPFVLSASPHFYEEAMRDWLYQHKIYTAGLYLKDYRKVLSLFDGDLTPKDLKIQGLYKLNHLLDILLMTGLPDKLILMGDNFESDPVIYCTLARLLNEETEPWALWNQLKAQDAFLLTRKQNAQFLNKIYQISSLINSRKTITGGSYTPTIQILIRRKKDEDSLQLSSDYDQVLSLVELYDGTSPEARLEAPPLSNSPS